MSLCKRARSVSTIPLIMLQLIAALQIKISFKPFFFNGRFTADCLYSQFRLPSSTPLWFRNGSQIPLAAISKFLKSRTLSFMRFSCKVDAPWTFWPYLVSLALLAPSLSSCARSDSDWSEPGLWTLQVCTHCPVKGGNFQLPGKVAQSCNQIHSNWIFLETCGLPSVNGLKQNKKVQEETFEKWSLI